MRERRKWFELPQVWYLIAVFLTKLQKPPKKHQKNKRHGVDGRNPALVDLVNIPIFKGFYTSQVVQDFFHQQYHQLTISWSLFPSPFSIANMFFAGKSNKITSGVSSNITNKKSLPPGGFTLRPWKYISKTQKETIVFQSHPFFLVPRKQALKSPRNSPCLAYKNASFLELVSELKGRFWTGLPRVSRSSWVNNLRGVFSSFSGFLSHSNSPILKNTWLFPGILPN